MDDAHPTVGCISTFKRQAVQASRNATAIDPAHDYGVEARILFKGRPLWIQLEPLPVITKGHPTVVEVTLQPPS